jgi:hypothetical protein
MREEEHKRRIVAKYPVMKFMKEVRAGNISVRMENVKAGGEGKSNVSYEICLKVLWKVVGSGVRRDAMEAVRLRLTWECINQQAASLGQLLVLMFGVSN